MVSQTANQDERYKMTVSLSVRPTPNDINDSTAAYGLITEMYASVQSLAIIQGNQTCRSDRALAGNSSAGKDATSKKAIVYFLYLFVLFILDKLVLI